jgi:hypothetical protein
MAEMFLPVVTLVFTTLSTLALLMGLRLVIPFDVVSLILTTLANYSLFYMLSRALMQYYEKIYEKHVFERFFLKPKPRFL